MQRPPGALFTNREATVVGDLYFFASDDLLLLPWAGGRQWRQGHPCASGGNYDGGGGVLVGALGDFGAMVPALGGGRGAPPRTLHKEASVAAFYHSRILRCEQSSCWGQTQRFCV